MVLSTDLVYLQETVLTKRMSSPRDSIFMLCIGILQRKLLEECKNLLFQFRNVFYLKISQTMPICNFSSAMAPGKSMC